MFLIAILHCISYRISKTSESASATFDQIACAAVIIIYCGLQLFIYVRHKRLSKLTGNRLFKEGGAFYNNMVRLRKGSLWYRPLTYETTQIASDGQSFTEAEELGVGIPRNGDSDF